MATIIDSDTTVLNKDVEYIAPEGTGIKLLTKFSNILWREQGADETFPLDDKAYNIYYLKTNESLVCVVNTLIKIQNEHMNDSIEIDVRQGGDL